MPDTFSNKLRNLRPFFVAGATPDTIALMRKGGKKLACSDKNPFGVKTNLKQTLMKRLSKAEQSMA